jgi:hypothetical protein
MRLCLTLWVLLIPATVWAEWQFKPFIGSTFGGTSTFVFTEEAASERHLATGGSATWLGNVFGVEGELGWQPTFFQSDDSVVAPLGSSVLTLTGNVVLTLPRKMTQYSLRPYFVAGGGLVRIAIDQQSAAFSVSKAAGVVDIGGGVTGFLTDRVGLNWDVRYFRSIEGDEGTGLTIGKEQISFWRATMGMAIRVGSPQ